VPLPRWLARINRRLTNPLLAPLAARLPGFGVVLHTGRVTGLAFRTPVNVFERGGRYVVALTYGPNSEWVRNVVSAGGCVLVHRRQRIPLASPRLERGLEEPGAVPRPIRSILALLGVDWFLHLQRP
jgi:deazaflavin-dependent oxidoreductase (nitroreductase family)